MAASDLALISSFNNAQATVKGDEAVAKQEERQKVVDERQETLFNRSTSLFEQQQKFLNDEEGLKKFGRKANQAVAMFNGTGGQVFQPMLDLYDSIPDGGKFHQFRRNEDGTFDFDVEWQGQRYTKKGANFNEVGKMAMSIANPVQYLEQSGAAAAAEAEFVRDKELARIRAQGNKQRGVTRLFGDKLSVKEWGDMRKGFLDEYIDFRDSQPELLEMPDSAAEGGVRQMTFEEYQTGKFLAIGIDVSGQVKDGQFDAATVPPDPFTASFNDMRAFAETSGLSPEQAMAAGVESFIRAGRVDELDEKFIGSGEGRKNTLSDALKNRIASAKIAASTGDDPAAKKADVDQALINVGEPAAGGAKRDTDPDNPFDKFAADNPQEDFSSVGEAFEAAKSAVTGAIDSVKASSRKAQIKLWKDFLKGASGDPKVLSLLQLGQTAAGRKEVGKQYIEVRLTLPAEMRRKLDKLFPQIVARKVPRGSSGDTVIPAG